MLSIILLILKYIGIILLGLIAIILLLLCLVLFVPVHYKISGSYYNETFKGNVFVSWLIKIFRVQVSIEDVDSQVEIKIFGFTLSGEKESAKKILKEAVEKPTKDIEEQVEEYIEKEYEEETGEKIIKDNEDSKNDIEKEKTNTKNIKEEKMTDSPTQLTVTNELEDIKGSEKNTGYSEKEKEKTPKKNKQKEKKKKTSKLKLLKQKIIEIKIFITDESNQNAFKLLWKETKYIFKHIKPKRFEVKARIGTGDPAETGKLLGGLSLLYMIKKSKIIIEPDFDNKVYEGEIKLYGKVRLIIFVKSFINILLDKNIRKIILARNN